MWTENKIIVGTESSTHSDMISDLEIHKIKSVRELWSMGRATEDFEVLYYYDISKLNNPNLNKLFKKFIQENM